MSKNRAAISIKNNNLVSINKVKFKTLFFKLSKSLKLVVDGKTKLLKTAIAGKFMIYTKNV